MKSECIDCLADYNAGLTGWTARPAPHPGPRCTTHHRAKVKKARSAAADSRRVARFNISGGTYRAMLADQEGACAACGTVPGPKAKRLAVDHDHKCCPGPTSCGKCIRGLLCYSCNTDILPAVGDDPTKLRRIAAYLERWKEKS